MSGEFESLKTMIHSCCTKDELYDLQSQVELKANKVDIDKLDD